MPLLILSLKRLSFHFEKVQVSLGQTLFEEPADHSVIHTLPNFTHKKSDKLFFII